MSEERPGKANTEELIKELEGKRIINREAYEKHVIKVGITGKGDKRYVSESEAISTIVGIVRHYELAMDFLKIQFGAMYSIPLSLLELKTEEAYSQEEKRKL